ncbi:MAG: hypothetical protein FWF49_04725 [Oscillospiraceae bacterium]|nr:hypothetical protein [Oscillospiraceae bacterium]
MHRWLSRLLVTLFALFLVSYTLYQGIRLFYKPVETETATLYTAFDAVDTTAFAVRSETPLTDIPAGALAYQIGDGGKVAKGGVIATAYATDAAAAAWQQSARLDSEIAELQTLQLQGTAGLSSLDAVQQQLEAALRAVAAGDPADALAQQDTWLLQMDKRQLIMGKVTDFTARIHDLTAQKNALAPQMTRATGQLTAPVSGYFIQHCDGLENTIPVGSVTSVTVDQVNAALAATPQLSATGKIVDAYDWYIVCVLPSDKALAMPLGKSFNVLFPFVSATPVPMTVAAMNQQGAETAAVLRCTNMSQDLANMRSEPVQIQLKQYTGLRIPTTALQTVNGQQGVYVVYAGMAVWRQVDILYSAPGYILCTNDPTASGALQLFDSVVIKAKGLYDGKILS